MVYMHITPKKFLSLFKVTFKDWRQDKASRLAAALAYYTIFSLAPTLIIAVAVAGMVFGTEAAQGELIHQLQGFLGNDAARTIQELIADANQPQTGSIAALAGIATLLFGASQVFAELQDSLNTIWGVAPKPGRGIWQILRERFLSFAMVLSIGFILLVSIVLSAFIAAAGHYIQDLLPGSESLLQILNIGVSFFIITLLFAMIFKVLPDVVVAWRDVWIGAALTSALFGLGKFLISVYLGQSAVASTFGAASSIIILVLWVYYSAQILFFGAEFTKVFAKTFGSKIIPNKNAVPLTAEARAELGIPSTEELESAVREFRNTKQPPVQNGHKIPS